MFMNEAGFWVLKIAGSRNYLGHPHSDVILVLNHSKFEHLVGGTWLKVLDDDGFNSYHTDYIKENYLPL